MECNYHFADTGKMAEQFRIFTKMIEPDDNANKEE